MLGLTEKKMMSHFMTTSELLWVVAAPSCLHSIKLASLGAEANTWHGAMRPEAMNPLASAIAICPPPMKPILCGSAAGDLDVSILFVARYLLKSSHRNREVQAWSKT